MAERKTVVWEAVVMLTNPVRLFGLLSCVCLLQVQVLVAHAQPADEYLIEYHVEFLPESKEASVRIRHTPRAGRMISLNFEFDAERYVDFQATGGLELDAESVMWRPHAETPSELTYRYRINYERRGGGYDALITPDWVIVRGDDLVPASRVRSSKDAESRAYLTFDMPSDWTWVDTPYRREAGVRHFFVSHADRRFDRPTGWLIAGQVSSRTETLMGTKISVTAPKGENIQRNVTLALMNGLVPELHSVFGDLPSKILIVTADDPMWRGGLSGPRSLYMHGDRPLISENGSSTLAHELVHVVSRLRATDQDDWIVEGLAEYYSIELLHRAGLLSETRKDKAFEWMARHGESVHTLNTNRSSAKTTARAVTLFADLDQEIRDISKGAATLDNIARKLKLARKVSREFVREEVKRLIGRESQVLRSELLN